MVIGRDWNEQEEPRERHNMDEGINVYLSGWPQHITCLTNLKTKWNWGKS